MSYVHLYRPATDPVEMRTLVLLHGTGADEHDLIPLARAVLPGAAILGLRGDVSENGMPRFFRRFAEGVFDLEDVAFRAQKLADFISEAAQTYAFDPAQAVAVGFSNGANIAAATMLLHPGTFGQAVLMRAMVTVRPDTIPDLSDSRILICSGKTDSIVPVEDASELADMFRSGGADVTHAWAESGHRMAEDEIPLIADWLAN
ncbi:MAG: alpha/beta hydrolase [Fimbriimonadaceae bacterium]|nr:alpha/beta hydrolase [Fimbriimonadaceae bacterium]